MAKEEKKKIERTYNIPLRKEFMKVPKYKRAKKAITALKRFLTRHMKSTNIKIGDNLNKNVWARGIKNPPHHVKVNVIKYDDGLVKAELVGFKIEEEKKEEKKKEKAKEEKKEEMSESKASEHAQKSKIFDKPKEEVKKVEKKAEDKKPETKPAPKKTEVKENALSSN